MIIWRLFGEEHPKTTPECGTRLCHRKMGHAFVLMSFTMPHYWGVVTTGKGFCWHKLPNIGVRCSHLEPSCLWVKHSETMLNLNETNLITHMIHTHMTFLVAFLKTFDFVSLIESSHGDFQIPTLAASEPVNPWIKLTEMMVCRLRSTTVFWCRRLLLDGAYEWMLYDSMMVIKTICGYDMKTNRWESDNRGWWWIRM